MHTRRKDTNRLKIKGYKKIVPASSNQKRAVVVTLSSDKIDFKSKPVTKKQQKRHYILIKGSVHQDNITIINMYAPNNRPLPKSVKQILMELTRRNR